MTDRLCSRCGARRAWNSRQAQVVVRQWEDVGSGNPEHPVREVLTDAGVLCEECTLALLRWWSGEDDEDCGSQSAACARATVKSARGAEGE